MPKLNRPKRISRPNAGLRMPASGTSTTRAENPPGA
jgi:hypothetical protein